MTTNVGLTRHPSPPTVDEFLWEIIKDRSAALGFARYTAFLDNVFAGTAPRRQGSKTRLDEITADQARLLDPDVQADEKATPRDELARERLSEDRDPTKSDSNIFYVGSQTRSQLGADVTDARQRILKSGFFDADAYQLLRLATEYYVYHEAGRLEDLGVETRPGSYLSKEFIDDFRSRYLETLTGQPNTTVLPYLGIIAENLAGLPVKKGVAMGMRGEDYGIVRSRLVSPTLVELIWNYWHEQGLLVQTMNLVSLRFQNIRRGRGLDPLASLEIDPLRPLSNVLWGYIQDEFNRLTVSRRAYEYAHGLGLQLVGKAIPEMHPADVRSQFLPAFHDLLRLAWIFFREDDDTTVVADSFPLLNALRELHFVVSEGAHNQFGDLPLRARIEMLMQQWVLARPEMREFLRGRTMVPYPEAWMDRVDAMKALQGWNDASVINYNDLAVFGEQIILSVRYGSWSTTTDQNQATNWARAWRPAIQRYTHALRIVSGIDLSVADPIEVRTESERIAQGMPNVRGPYPGGRLSRSQPAPAPALAPRPGAEKILRQVPVQPAPVLGNPINPARRR